MQIARAIEYRTCKRVTRYRTCLMGQRKDLDATTRRRIAAWFRHFFSEYGHQYPTQADFADALNLAQSTIANIINERRDPGLDAVIKLHRTFHVQLDKLIESDPPTSGREGRTGIPGPHEASPKSTAGRRRQSSGGGGDGEGGK